MSVRHREPVAPDVERPDTTEWPERWPVIAPSVGTAMGLAWTAVAVADGDWAATTIFGAVTATVGLVGIRNYRLRRS